MEGFDSGKEQQVWQRVIAPAMPERGDLRTLILSAQESAAAYKALTGLLTGSARERARRLWEQEQESVACLRGLQRLAGGPAAKARALPGPQGPAAKLLERGYHRARRAMTEYTARSTDPEFGVVFQELAHRAQENCIILAALLGGNV